MPQKRNVRGELNFYLLKCLVALVDHSHVSRAAESLSVSQPAMSRAMSQLRKVTADPILVKAGPGLIPTAKALQLREFAERILGEMGQLLGDAVAFDPQRSEHQFRLMGSDHVECLFMGRLVQHLGRRYPGITVSVRHPVHPTQLNKALEVGELDFVIGLLPASLRELRHRLIIRDRIVCVASANHWAVGRSLSAAEFAALEHVAIMPNTLTLFGEAVDQALSAQGLRRNRRFITPNYLTAAHLVQTSSMVALLPLSLATQFQTLFALAQLPLPISVPALDICIAWHDRTHRHAPHVWFREQVMQSLAFDPHGPDWAYASTQASVN